MKKAITLLLSGFLCWSCFEENGAPSVARPDAPPTYERLGFYGTVRATASHYEKPAGEHVVGSFDLDAIDYDHPEKYTTNGPQSELDERFVAEIRRKVDPVELDLAGLAQLLDWFKREIAYARDDRSARLKLSANEVYSAGTQGGCTEAALLFASVTRSFGFPSVLVSTVDLPAAKTTRIGEPIRGGHQMVEVFVDGAWVLVDQNGWIGRDYDPRNPYIHRVIQRGDEESERFEGLVNSKGVDYATEGVLEDGDYARQCADTIRALRNGEYSEYQEAKPLVMERYRRFLP